MSRERTACRDFPELSVSDDPRDRARLELHASTCEACAARLELHLGLAERLRAWGEEAPEPSPALRRRVLDAYRTRRPVPAAPETDARAPAPEETPGGRLVAFPRPLRLAGRWATAAALVAAAVATVVILLFPGSPPAPQTAQRLLVAEALEEAMAAEQAHVRAIARLEAAAAPLLARADDPRLSAVEAARLLAIRDHLAFLDSTIEEIRGFLADNPAHPGGRTLLAAAYHEKTQVLSDLLEKEPSS